MVVFSAQRSGTFQRKLGRKSVEVRIRIRTFSKLGLRSSKKSSRSETQDRGHPKNTNKDEYHDGFFSKIIMLSFKSCVVDPIPVGCGLFGRIRILALKNDYITTFLLCVKATKLQGIPVVQLFGSGIFFFE
jgi:hypothetical protein